MKKSLETVVKDDFDEISAYYVNGKSSKLTESQQKILERWRAVDGILRKFPTKSIAVRKLVARYPEISERQARIDIDNACKFWDLHNRVDKDFINRWFVEKLLSEIANKFSSQVVRAKNLATLGRYIENMPEDVINPKYFENNSTYIQININQNTVNLSEKDLINFPKNVREKLLGIVNNSNEITEDIASEIMDS